ncbi:GAP family protein [Allonocardiopsis opalescens]|uniref:Sap-like sulfolipid-1-addressing protein n=1 Tax=Allonocardiopsis opalescens TaxID=1144618 RepID=A0A2T0QB03_9ACTN|nr:GAP family protein [Allonocardiopsis opalescens]PRY00991.1 Sap-like sulfolipid-1-addressing protein [Allonocardiopsis opalescens]
MTIGLVLTLGALALVDSTSFGTLGIPVYLMVATRRSVAARLLAFLGTIAVFYFAVGVALMLGLSAVMENFGEALDSRPAYWAQLAIGVGLFVLSFRFDSKKRPGPDASRWEHRLSSPGAMVLLALTAALLEVATMVPYLAAVGMMTTSELPPAQWLPLLGGYVLVMILPALVLLGLRAVAGRWLEPKLARLSAWIQRNAASAVGWALAIVGFLLARDAAAYLFPQYINVG